MSGFTLDTSPLPQEVIKLGLADAPFLLPDDQVKVSYGQTETGENKLVIYVHDIEVLAMDPASKNVRYRVIGLRQYMQNWDTGGSYLDPQFIDPETLGDVNG